MSGEIIDQPDKVAFRNDIGNDIAWGNLDYGDASDEQRAEFEASYEIVKNGNAEWFHTDGDLYQGSTLMRVIRRKADGELFGFPYWVGGGKHGETNVESNGDEHGFPSKYDWQEGIDEEESWFVFLPVESSNIPAYKIKESS
ncbi:hypothetical protein [Arthrobacter sp. GMC3]|uniref:hypothetical protein n=1 Tax=Arthrobacter sp. GMC3 TaxID=2058894 RepID=UPI000CE5703F|nr:hypothetical protein [Arthrobacter sp. GMC3]